MKTNCLFFAIKYRLSHRYSILKAEFDDEFCFYHFYIIDGDREIHCEQKNKNEKWKPLFEAKIVSLRLRKKNR